MERAMFIFILIFLLLVISAFSENQEEKTSVGDFNRKMASSTKSAKIHSYDFNQPDYIFSINWSEGEKNFLTFRGCKYELQLDYNQTQGKIKRIIFNFKDSSDPDKSISIKKEFEAPFNGALGQEADRLLNLLFEYMKKATINDTDLIETFDLRPFYLNFIKKDAIESLSD